jgi:hypothetical protein
VRTDLDLDLDLEPDPHLYPLRAMRYLASLMTVPLPGSVQ